MIRKARKKPVEIEYMTFDELHELFATRPARKHLKKEDIYSKILDKMYYTDNFQAFLIDTLEGTMKMTNKDVLIIGVRGEIYPCKIDIFYETYEINKEE